MTDILYPVLSLGGLGLLFGLVLGYASKKFAVPVDEKVPLIRDVFQEQTVVDADLLDVMLMLKQ